MKCSRGCGLPATHQLKSGKHVCHKIPSKCPTVKANVVKNKQNRIQERANTTELCKHGCGKIATHYDTKLDEWQCAESHLSCISVQSRREQTNIKQNGCSNPLHKYNNDGQPKRVEAMTKRADTMNERYGHLDRMPWADDMIASYHDTNEKRYGVSNPSKLQITKDKIANTKIEKYGNPVGPLHNTQYQTSKIEHKWLDSLNIPNEYRNKLIPKTRLIADALDVDNKIVYEFYGSYWHGNPRMFDANEYNKSTKCTYGKLYQRTILREEKIKKLGYTIVSIWEDEFKGR